MPTVSQHYGHHAAPRTDKSALATRQAAAPVVLMVSGGADSTALLLMACWISRTAAASLPLRASDCTCCM